MPALRSALLRRCLPILAALIGVGAMAGSAQASTGGPLTFDGSFQTGPTPWASAGGGPQCANYGTPSTAPRLRGNFVDDATTFVDGVQAGRFDLPASQPPTYTMEACELTNPRPLGLGSDDYYSYMFYVPAGWRSGTSEPSGFWGITTAQFHFQNIWGSPIEFELHDDHMTLALETGACNDQYSSDPGCQWRSNADAPDGNPGNVGAHYVVPSPMQTGVWHQIVMHVHWAADSTGQIQVWHRIMGQTSWTQTVNLSGYPTVQWDVTQGCCYANAVDKVGAYRATSSAPVSVWEAEALIGTTFNSVADALPTAPGTPPASAAAKHSKPPSPPSFRRIRALLARLVARHGTAVNIEALLKHGGYSLTFKAPSAGGLMISWYLVPKGARVARSTPPVVVARGTVVFPRTGHAKRFRLKLTPRGRRLLEHAKELTITSQRTFTPKGDSGTSRSEKIALKR